MRPRNISVLALMRYRWPVTAIVSILHRASGLLVFLMIPLLLYVFDLSLHSAASFAALAAFCSGWVIKFMAWVFLSALAYHCIAGVKHLAMDAGFFEALSSSFWASLVVIILSAVVIVGLGVWLW